VHARLALAVAAALTVGTVAHAQPSAPTPTPTPAAPNAPAPAPTPNTPAPGADEPGPAQAITQRIGVWRIEPLGIDAELAQRLETLFRVELDRLAAQPMPSRRDLDRVVDSSLKDCTGEDKCLAAIGKKVGVDVMVSGSVGELGDNYILNIKAVDVAAGKQIRKIQSDPLKGSPDELIEGIRVAAYKLLAPDQLHGSIVVLSDLVGATVKLDGTPVGKTPLAAPIAQVSLGTHLLRVEAKGYQPFEDKVDVRFQKSSRVVVRLIDKIDPNAPVTVVTRHRDPWYSRWYVVAAIGVVAIGAGIYVGRELATVETESAERIAQPEGIGP
jgi:hypothetical protein